MNGELLSNTIIAVALIVVIGAVIIVGMLRE